MNSIVFAVLSAFFLAFLAVQNVEAQHRFHPMNAGTSGPQNTSSPFNDTISGLFPEGSFPSDSEIQRYHIVLWTALGLAVAAIGAVYSLAFMDFKKDTILYSTFNPNWEERKRR